MVAIVKRMRKLRTLLAIRLGPGAAILPPEVTRIHMDFAVQQADGHRGAKFFWRNCLRRLKYHNPAVPMSVTRTTNQEGPALMTIHFTSPESASSSSPPISSTTQPHTSSATVASSTPDPRTERTETINMKHRHESEILSQLMALTKAKAVRATAEEARQIQEIEEQRAQSDKDAALQRAHREKVRREQAILTQARGEIDGA